MQVSLPIPVITIGLLLASNVFTAFAWYGQLKFQTASLVIAMSWGTALFGYMFMVPSNRIGHGAFFIFHKWG